MKKILLLMVFFASTFTASAQDVIVKKDGSTILSKVIEIGTTEVKYKKWNNQKWTELHDSQVRCSSHQL